MNGGAEICNCCKFEKMALEVSGVKVTTEKGMRVKIRNAMNGLGIYREEFEWQIQMLAELFIRREETKEAFRKSGGAAIIKQTNKGGNSYAVKNPLLAEIDFVEKRIIDLAREMGLTTQAIRKINEAALGKKPQPADDPLALALGELRLLKTGSE